MNFNNYVGNDTSSNQNQEATDPASLANLGDAQVSQIGRYEKPNALPLSVQQSQSAGSAVVLSPQVSVHPRAHKNQNTSGDIINKRK